MTSSESPMRKLAISLGVGLLLVATPARAVSPEAEAEFQRLRALCEANAPPGDEYRMCIDVVLRYLVPEYGEGLFPSPGFSPVPIEETCTIHYRDHNATVTFTGLQALSTCDSYQRSDGAWIDGPVPDDGLCCQEP